MTDLKERPAASNGAAGKTPPQDIAAEQCVLGGMMLSKDAISDVSEALKPGDFYRPIHATIFDAIIDLYSRGEPADAITVAAALDSEGDLGRIGGAPYLHTLIASVPMAAHAAFYARIVAEKAVKRRLAEAGVKIVQLGYDSGDVDDAVDRAGQLVYDVTERRVSEDFAILADMLQPTLDEIEAVGAQGGVMTGVPTGFTDLDRLLNGLHSGQLIIVAGRPGIGKSTMAFDALRNSTIRANAAGAIFSLEMSKVEIVMRLLSAEARVPLNVIRSGQLSDDDWTKLARCMAEISEAPLFVDDTPNMNLMEIRAKARRLKQRHDLKLIVVDYLQLMSSPKRTESRQQEVSEISRGLKLLAKEVEVPVIAVSQLNRGPEQRTDKRPQLSDLRESGCMTEDTTLLRADTGAPVTFGQLLREGGQGTLVWSLDEHRRMVSAPVTAVFPSGVKDVYRLRLASGREVKSSGNHPFLTFNGWRSLDSLNVGDRIAIPRRVPEPANAGLGWSEHRMALLAYLIADGTVLPSHAVQIADDDPEVLAYAAEAARAEFGIVARHDLGAAGRCPVVYLPSPYRLTHGRRNPIQQWFRDLGIDGLRSAEKRLPDILYTASNTEIARFLRHLVSTDGCVASPKGKSAGLVRYDTTSRALADGVAALLARFGIIARLRRVPQGEYRDAWTVTIADGPSVRVFAERIGAFGRTAGRLAALVAAIADRPTNTNADTIPLEVWELVENERYRAGLTGRQFQAAIGANYSGTALFKSCPSRERLARCARVLDSGVLLEATNNDVFWDRIVEVEPLGRQPVYDATVDGTHNFVADGILAHNSIEQDADVVILLHRDDYYDKESPRAGEADFIVAKHRNGPTDTITVAAQLHLSRFVDMAI